MCDGEHLPPYAFINRTDYPVVHHQRRHHHGWPRPQLSLGIISDVQYADRKTQDRRHYKLSAKKLQQAVDEINENRSEHLDLVVNLGDLVDSDMAKHGPPTLKILSKLKTKICHLLGNHDYYGLPEERFGEVPEMLSMPGRFYSIVAGRKGAEYRLIFLDGNDISMYATSAASPRRKQAERMIGNLKKIRAKNAQAFNGGVGDEQLLWLKKELGAACRSGQRAVVMLHHALMPKGDRTNLWNDRSLVETIVQFHCCVAVFNGHAHKFNYDFALSRHRQVHMVTFGGMVQSPFQSYAFADFYADELHVHGLVFGRQIDYRLNLSTHGAVNDDDAAADVFLEPTVVSTSGMFKDVLNEHVLTSAPPRPASSSAAAAGVVALESHLLLFGSSFFFPVVSILMLIGFFLMKRARWRRQ